MSTANSGWLSSLTNGITGAIGTAVAAGENRLQNIINPPVQGSVGGQTTAVPSNQGQPTLFGIPEQDFLVVGIGAAIIVFALYMHKGKK